MRQEEASDSVWRVRTLAIWSSRFRAILDKMGPQCSIRRPTARMARIPAQQQVECTGGVRQGEKQVAGSTGAAKEAAEMEAIAELSPQPVQYHSQGRNPHTGDQLR